MKKITLSMVSDWLFYFFAAFFLSFAIINYFVPRPFSFIYSALLAALFCLFTVKLTLKKQTVKNVKKQDEKLFLKTMSALSLMEEREKIEFFIKVYQALDVKTERRRGCLLLPRKNEKAFFYIGFQPLSKTDAVRAFNRLNEGEKAVIYCSSADEEIKGFCARFGGRLVLKSDADAFLIIKKAGVFPPQKIELTDADKSTLPQFKTLLLKRKSKTFSAFGFGFLTLSFFVPFKTYYVAVGFVSLLFALFLRFFGKSEQSSAG